MAIERIPLRCLMSWLIPLSVLGMPLLLVGCGHESTPVTQALPPQAVKVMTVEPRTVPIRYEFVGMTDASKTVEIRARVQGFLDQRAFEEGGKVSEGDLLFQIDPRSFQAELEAAEARLQMASAQRQTAERKMTMLKPLVEKGVATQKEFDDAVDLFNEAEAAVRNGEASVRAAQLELSYTTIRSPLTGKVSQSLREVGSLVDAGSNSLLTTVVQLDPIWVRFSIPERGYLRWVEEVSKGIITIPDRQNIPVVITLIDGSEYPITGRLDFLDVRVNPSTGSADARAALANPQQRLLPGQFVRVTIKGWERPNTLTIPQRAVIQTPTGSYAYVVNQDNKVELRRLVLGDWVEQDWIVTQGVNAGDRVMVDGMLKVQPGMTVTIVEPSTAQRDVRSSKPDSF